MKLKLAPNTTEIGSGKVMYELSLARFLPLKLHEDTAGIKRSLKVLAAEPWLSDH